LTHFLEGARKNLFQFFSIKETIFAGFASLLTQGRAASHPQPAFGGQSRRARIPSPKPPSFLPACLGFAQIFFRRKITKGWQVG
jgi:hypothetical protein